MPLARIRSVIAFAATVALSGSACSSDMVGEPLAHQLDDARTVTDAMRAEVDAHAAAAEAATDLAALRAEEPPHQMQMGGHMDDLDHAIDDMHLCEGAPDDELDTMMDRRELCGTELERHLQAITDADDLTAARAEELAHHTAMMERLDALDAVGDTMMHSHGTMMCMGHHGMDDHDDD